MDWILQAGSELLEPPLCAKAELRDHSRRNVLNELRFLWEKNMQETKVIKTDEPEPTVFVKNE